MTVTDVRKDPEARTLAITSEFDADIDRVWQMWSDPRLLERWWGPPTYPATFVDHELAPGGVANYYMTSPEGERFHGWWEVTSVDPPKHLTFRDGFADSNGKPADDMPVSTAQVRLEEVAPSRTRMTIESTFESIDDMNRIVEMGALEGMSQALGQIDDLLAA